MRVFLDLFIEFFQIGLFAVGGGPATIPFLMDLPSRHMATYAGYNAAGFLGGIVATLSLVLPSLITIILIAKLLESFSKNMYVKSAFYTIRPAVTGLIATAVWGIWQTTLFTAADGSLQFPVLSVVLCVLFFAAMNIKKLKKLHPAFWILCGAIVGILFKM